MDIADMRDVDKLFARVEYVRRACEVDHWQLDISMRFLNACMRPGRGKMWQAMLRVEANADIPIETALAIFLIDRDYALRRLLVRKLRKWQSWHFKMRFPGNRNAGNSESEKAENRIPGNLKGKKTGNQISQNMKEQISGARIYPEKWS